MKKLIRFISIVMILLMVSSPVTLAFNQFSQMSAMRTGANTPLFTVQGPGVNIGNQPVINTPTFTVPQTPTFSIGPDLGTIGSSPDLGFTGPIDTTPINLDTANVIPTTIAPSTGSIGFSPDFFTLPSLTNIQPVSFNNIRILDTRISTLTPTVDFTSFSSIDSLTPAAIGQLPLIDSTGQVDVPDLTIDSAGGDITFTSLSSLSIDQTPISFDNIDTFSPATFGQPVNVRLSKQSMDVILDNDNFFEANYIFKQDGKVKLITIDKSQIIVPEASGPDLVLRHDGALFKGNAQVLGPGNVKIKDRGGTFDIEIDAENLRGRIRTPAGNIQIPGSDVGKDAMNSIDSFAGIVLGQVSPEALGSSLGVKFTPGDEVDGQGNVLKTGGYTVNIGPKVDETTRFADYGFGINVQKPDGAPSEIIKQPQGALSVRDTAEYQKIYDLSHKVGGLENTYEYFPATMLAVGQQLVREAGGLASTGAFDAARDQITEGLAFLAPVRGNVGEQAVQAEGALYLSQIQLGLNNLQQSKAELARYSSLVEQNANSPDFSQIISPQAAQLAQNIEQAIIQIDVQTQQQAAVNELNAISSLVQTGAAGSDQALTRISALRDSSSITHVNDLGHAGFLDYLELAARVQGGYGDNAQGDGPSLAERVSASTESTNQQRLLADQLLVESSQDAIEIQNVLDQDSFGTGLEPQQDIIVHANNVLNNPESTAKTKLSAHLLLSSAHATLYEHSRTETANSLGVTDFDASSYHIQSQIGAVQNAMDILDFDIIDATTTFAELSEQTRMRAGLTQQEAVLQAKAGRPDQFQTGLAEFSEIVNDVENGFDTGINPSGFIPAEGVYAQYLAATAIGDIDQYSDLLAQSKEKGGLNQQQAADLAAVLAHTNFVEARKDFGIGLHQSALENFAAARSHALEAAAYSNNELQSSATIEIPAEIQGSYLGADLSIQGDGSTALEMQGMLDSVLMTVYTSDAQAMKDYVTQNTQNPSLLSTVSQWMAVQQELNPTSGPNEVSTLLNLLFNPANVIPSDVNDNTFRQDMSLTVQTVRSVLSAELSVDGLSEFFDGDLSGAETTAVSAALPIILGKLPQDQLQSLRSEAYYASLQDRTDGSTYQIPLIGVSTGIEKSKPLEERISETQVFIEAVNAEIDYELSRGPAQQSIKLDSLYNQLSSAEAEMQGMRNAQSMQNKITTPLIDALDLAIAQHEGISSLEFHTNKALEAAQVVQQFKASDAVSKENMQVEVDQYVATTVAQAQGILQTAQSGSLGLLQSDQFAEMALLQMAVNRVSDNLVSTKTVQDATQRNSAFDAIDAFVFDPLRSLIGQTSSKEYLFESQNFAADIQNQAQAQNQQLTVLVDLIQDGVATPDQMRAFRGLDSATATDRLVELYDNVGIAVDQDVATRQANVILGANTDGTLIGAQFGSVQQNFGVLEDVTSQNFFAGIARHVSTPTGYLEVMATSYGIGFLVGNVGKVVQGWKVAANTRYTTGAANGANIFTQTANKAIAYSAAGLQNAAKAVSAPFLASRPVDAAFTNLGLSARQTLSKVPIIGQPAGLVAQGSVRTVNFLTVQTLFEEGILEGQAFDFVISGSGDFAEAAAGLVNNRRGIAIGAQGFGVSTNGVVPVSFVNSVHDAMITLKDANPDAQVITLQTSENALGQTVSILSEVTIGDQKILYAQQGVELSALTVPGMTLAKNSENVLKLGSTPTAQDAVLDSFAKVLFQSNLDGAITSIESTPTDARQVITVTLANGNTQRGILQTSSEGLAHIVLPSSLENEQITSVTSVQTTTSGQRVSVTQEIDQLTISDVVLESLIEQQNAIQLINIELSSAIQHNDYAAVLELLEQQDIDLSQVPAISGLLDPVDLEILQREEISSRMLALQQTIQLLEQVLRNQGYILSSHELFDTLTFNGKQTQPADITTQATILLGQLSAQYLTSQAKLGETLPEQADSVVATISKFNDEIRLSRVDIVHDPVLAALEIDVQEAANDFSFVPIESILEQVTTKEFGGQTQAYIGDNVIDFLTKKKQLSEQQIIDYVNTLPGLTATSCGSVCVTGSVAQAQESLEDLVHRQQIKQDIGVLAQTQNRLLVLQLSDPRIDEGFIDLLLESQGMYSLEEITTEDLKTLTTAMTVLLSKDQSAKNNDIYNAIIQSLRIIPSVDAQRDQSALDLYWNSKQHPESPHLSTVTEMRDHILANLDNDNLLDIENLIAQAKSISALGSQGDLYIDLEGRLRLQKSSTKSPESTGFSPDPYLVLDKTGSRLLIGSDYTQKYELYGFFQGQPDGSNPVLSVIRNQALYAQSGLEENLLDVSFVNEQGRIMGYSEYMPSAQSYGSWTDEQKSTHEDQVKKAVVAALVFQFNFEQGNENTELDFNSDSQFLSDLNTGNLLDIDGVFTLIDLEDIDQTGIIYRRAGIYLPSSYQEILQEIIDLKLSFRTEEELRNAVFDATLEHTLQPNTVVTAASAQQAVDTFNRMGDILIHFGENGPRFLDLTNQQRKNPFVAPDALTDVHSPSAERVRDLGNQKLPTTVEERQAYEASFRDGARILASTEAEQDDLVVTFEFPPESQVHVSTESTDITVDATVQDPVVLVDNLNDVLFPFSSDSVDHLVQTEIENPLDVMVQAFRLDATQEMIDEIDEKIESLVQDDPIDNNPAGKKVTVSLPNLKQPGGPELKVYAQVEFDVVSVNGQYRPVSQVVLRYEDTGEQVIELELDGQEKSPRVFALLDRASEVAKLQHTKELLEQGLELRGQLEIGTVPVQLPSMQVVEPLRNLVEQVGLSSGNAQLIQEYFNEMLDIADTALSVERQGQPAPTPYREVLLQQIDEYESVPSTSGLLSISVTLNEIMNHVREHSQSANMNKQLIMVDAFLGESFYRQVAPYVNPFYTHLGKYSSTKQKAIAQYADNPFPVQPINLELGDTQTSVYVVNEANVDVARSLFGRVLTQVPPQVSVSKIKDENGKEMFFGLTSEEQDIEFFLSDPQLASLFGLSSREVHDRLLAKYDDAISQRVEDVDSAHVAPTPEGELFLDVDIDSDSTSVSLEDPFVIPFPPINSEPEQATTRDAGLSANEIEEIFNEYSDILGVEVVQGQPATAQGVLPQQLNDFDIGLHVLEQGANLGAFAGLAVQDLEILVRKRGLPTLGSLGVGVNFDDPNHVQVASQYYTAALTLNELAFHHITSGTEVEIEHKISGVGIFKKGIFRGVDPNGNLRFDLAQGSVTLSPTEVPTIARDLTNINTVSQEIDIAQIGRLHQIKEQMKRQDLNGNTFSLSFDELSLVALLGTSQNTEDIIDLVETRRSYQADNLDQFRALLTTIDPTLASTFETATRSELVKFMNRKMVAAQFSQVLADYAQDPLSAEFELLSLVNDKEFLIPYESLEIQHLLVFLQDVASFGPLNHITIEGQLFSKAQLETGVFIGGKLDDSTIPNVNVGGPQKAGFIRLEQGVLHYYTLDGTAIIGQDASINIFGQSPTERKNTVVQRGGSQVLSQISHLSVNDQYIDIEFGYEAKPVSPPTRLPAIPQMSDEYLGLEQSIAEDGVELGVEIFRNSPSSQTHEKAGASEYAARILFYQGSYDVALGYAQDAVAEYQAAIDSGQFSGYEQRLLGVLQRDAENLVQTIVLLQQEVTQSISAHQDTFDRHLITGNVQGALDALTQMHQLALFNPQPGIIEQIDQAAAELQELMQESTVTPEHQQRLNQLLDQLGQEQFEPLLLPEEYSLPSADAVPALEVSEQRPSLFGQLRKKLNSILGGLLIATSALSVNEFVEFTPEGVVVGVTIPTTSEVIAQNPPPIQVPANPVVPTPTPAPTPTPPVEPEPAPTPAPEPVPEPVVSFPDISDNSLASDEVAPQTIDRISTITITPQIGVTKTDGVYYLTIPAGQSITIDGQTINADDHLPVGEPFLEVNIFTQESAKEAYVVIEESPGKVRTINLATKPDIGYFVMDTQLPDGFSIKGFQLHKDSGRLVMGQDGLILSEGRITLNKGQNTDVIETSETVRIDFSDTLQGNEPSLLYSNNEIVMLNTGFTWTRYEGQNEIASFEATGNVLKTDTQDTRLAITLVETPQGVAINTDSIELPAISSMSPGAIPALRELSQDDSQDGILKFQEAFLNALVLKVKPFTQTIKVGDQTLILRTNDAGTGVEIVAGDQTTATVHLQELKEQLDTSIFALGAGDRLITRQAMIQQLDLFEQSGQTDFELFVDIKKAIGLAQNAAPTGVLSLLNINNEKKNIAAKAIASVQALQGNLEDYSFRVPGKESVMRVQNWEFQTGGDNYYMGGADSQFTIHGFAPIKDEPGVTSIETRFKGVVIATNDLQIPASMPVTEKDADLTMGVGETEIRNTKGEVDVSAWAIGISSSNGVPLVSIMGKPDLTLTGQNAQEYANTWKQSANGVISATVRPNKDELGMFGAFVPDQVQIDIKPFSITLNKPGVHRVPLEIVSHDLDYVEAYMDFVVDSNGVPQDMVVSVEIFGGVFDFQPFSITDLISKFGLANERVRELKQQEGIIQHPAPTEGPQPTPTPTPEPFIPPSDTLDDVPSEVPEFTSFSEVATDAKAAFSLIPGWANLVLSHFDPNSPYRDFDGGTFLESFAKPHNIPDEEFEREMREQEADSFGSAAAVKPETHVTETVATAMVAQGGSAQVIFEQNLETEIKEYVLYTYDKESIPATLENQIRANTDQANADLLLEAITQTRDLVDLARGMPASDILDTLIDVQDNMQENNIGVEAAGLAILNEQLDQWMAGARAVEQKINPILDQNLPAQELDSALDQAAADLFNEDVLNRDSEQQVRELLDAILARSIAEHKIERSIFVSLTNRLGDRMGELQGQSQTVVEYVQGTQDIDRSGVSALVLYEVEHLRSIMLAMQSRGYPAEEMAEILQKVAEQNPEERVEQAKRIFVDALSGEHRELTPQLQEARVQDLIMDIVLNQNSAQATQALEQLIGPDAFIWDDILRLQEQASRFENSPGAVLMHMEREYEVIVDEFGVYPVVSPSLERLVDTLLDPRSPQELRDAQHIINQVIQAQDAAELYPDQVVSPSLEGVVDQLNPFISQNDIETVRTDAENHVERMRVRLDLDSHLIETVIDAQRSLQQEVDPSNDCLCRAVTERVRELINEDNIEGALVDTRRSVRLLDGDANVLNRIAEDLNFALIEYNREASLLALTRLKSARDGALSLGEPGAALAHEITELAIGMVNSLNPFRIMAERQGEVIMFNEHGAIEDVRNEDIGALEARVQSYITLLDQIGVTTGVQAQDILSDLQERRRTSSIRGEFSRVTDIENIIQKLRNQGKNVEADKVQQVLDQATANAQQNFLVRGPTVRNGQITFLKTLDSDTNTPIYFDLAVTRDGTLLITKPTSQDRAEGERFGNELFKLFGLDTLETRTDGKTITSEFIPDAVSLDQNIERQFYYAQHADYFKQTVIPSIMLGKFEKPNEPLTVHSQLLHIDRDHRNYMDVNGQPKALDFELNSIYSVATIAGIFWKQQAIDPQQGPEQFDTLLQGRDLEALVNLAADRAQVSPRFRAERLAHLDNVRPIFDMMLSAVGSTPVQPTPTIASLLPASVVSMLKITIGLEPSSLLDTVFDVDTYNSLQTNEERLDYIERAESLATVLSLDMNTLRTSPEEYREATNELLEGTDLTYDDLSQIESQDTFLRLFQVAINPPSPLAELAQERSSNRVGTSPQRVANLEQKRKELLALRDSFLASSEYDTLEDRIREIDTLLNQDEASAREQMSELQQEFIKQGLFVVHAASKGKGSSIDIGAEFARLQGLYESIPEYTAQPHHLIYDSQNNPIGYVMEYAGISMLDFRVNTRTPIPEELARAQIEALSALSRSGKTHGDVLERNVGVKPIINENGEVVDFKIKLIDPSFKRKDGTFTQETEIADTLNRWQANNLVGLREFNDEFDTNNLGFQTYAFDILDGHTMTLLDTAVPVEGIVSPSTPEPILDAYDPRSELLIQGSTTAAIALMESLKHTLPTQELRQEFTQNLPIASRELVRAAVHFRDPSKMDNIAGPNLISPELKAEIGRSIESLVQMEAQMNEQAVVKELLTRSPEEFESQTQPLITTPLEVEFASDLSSGGVGMRAQDFNALVNAGDFDQLIQTLEATAQLTLVESEINKLGVAYHYKARDLRSKGELLDAREEYEQAIQTYREANREAGEVLNDNLDIALEELATLDQRIAAERISQAEAALTFSKQAVEVGNAAAAQAIIEAILPDLQKSREVSLTLEQQVRQLEHINEQLLKGVSTTEAIKKDPNAILTGHLTDLGALQEILGINKLDNTVGSSNVLFVGNAKQVLTLNEQNYASGVQFTPSDVLLELDVQQLVDDMYGGPLEGLVDIYIGKTIVVPNPGDLEQTTTLQEGTYSNIGREVLESVLRLSTSSTSVIPYEFQIKTSVDLTKYLKSISSSNEGIASFVTEMLEERGLQELDGSTYAAGQNPVPSAVLPHQLIRGLHINYEIYNTLDAFDRGQDPTGDFDNAGAGIMVFCPDTNEVLLGRREATTLSGKLGIFGGMRKETENGLLDPLVTAVTEYKEEAGQMPRGQLRRMPHTVTGPNNFVYSTYILEVSRAERDALVPTKNYEHSEILWMDASQAAFDADVLPQVRDVIENGLKFDFTIDIQNQVGVIDLSEEFDGFFSGPLYELTDTPTDTVAIDTDAEAHQALLSGSSIEDYTLAIDGYRSLLSQEVTPSRLSGLGLSLHSQALITLRTDPSAALLLLEEAAQQFKDTETLLEERGWQVPAKVGNNLAATEARIEQVTAMI